MTDEVKARLREIERETRVALPSSAVALARMLRRDAECEGGLSPEKVKLLREALRLMGGGELPARENNWNRGVLGAISPVGLHFRGDER